MTMNAQTTMAAIVVNDPRAPAVLSPAISRTKTSQTLPNEMTQRRDDKGSTTG